MCVHVSVYARVCMGMCVCTCMCMCLSNWGYCLTTSSLANNEKLGWGLSRRLPLFSLPIIHVVEYLVS